MTQDLTPALAHSFLNLTALDEAGTKAVTMNIGQAAAASGLSSKMIRHYEATGLISDIARAEQGYRRYQAADIERLRLIRHARELGFSSTEIRELLSLWNNPTRHRSQVKQLAQTHLQTLHQKIHSLQVMAQSLQTLVDRCAGDQQPDCPILAELATSAQSGMQN